MMISSIVNKLVIEKQGSLGEEKISINGIPQLIFCVVKNLPFDMVVSSSSLDLNKSLSAKLFYDFAEGEEMKEVEMLHSSPMEYKIQCNESGDSAVISIRILTLSSQHEGTRFRIRIRTIDQKTEENVDVFSQMIRVVSKRSQVQKRKFEVAFQTEVAEVPEVTSPSKRTSFDQISASLSNLEKLQLEHHKLLQQLLTIKTQPIVQPPLESTSDDFEQELQTFLNVYKKIPMEQRRDKVRNVLKEVPKPRCLDEFIKVYYSEKKKPTI